MEDSVEGPSATKKQKIEDRGILRKLSGAAIIVYTGRIAARANDVCFYLVLFSVCLTLVSQATPFAERGTQLSNIAVW